MRSRVPGGAATIRSLLMAVLGLQLVIVPVRSSAVVPQEAELEKGIRQAQDGDFEAAVITLDAAARRLAEQKGNPKDLSRAYVYLAISYLGLSQEQAAKAKFLEAWKVDRTMQPSVGEFPPRILRLLEEARKQAYGAEPAAAPDPQQGATASQGTTSPAKGSSGKGSKLPLVLAGVAGAGAAVALAARGGGSSASAAAPTCSPGQVSATSARFEPATQTCPVGGFNSTRTILVDVRNSSTATVTISSAVASATCLQAVGVTCNNFNPTNVSFTPSFLGPNSSATVQLTLGTSCTNPAGGPGQRFLTQTGEATLTTSCGSVSAATSNLYRMDFQ